ncbi:MlaD protein [Desulfacinum hydrothermale DSM 13146]|uniref:MlaD protein n=1 Tax=Desulfacinum hydrothermale DSM 13146 TaxID=1121390 RepID=A0A1W1XMM4_9BACT|nr:MlaD family protein [Desulfacinum hydrothermale]SMC25203.1 MlaD protein [Desulfacinum hydrothermale DSM 13146]
MARRVNTFKIGLFVILCGGIGLVALIWLGASHFFEEKATYVTYFAESVKGLQQDAIVNYRGVAIGRVASVELAPDGRLIQVVMHLRPDFKVDETLAIRLREQGLTGLRFLEIDTAPPDVDRATPPLDFEPPYPVIRSYPSEFQQLKGAFESLYAKVVSLDLNGLTERWKQVGETINRIFGGTDLETTLRNVREDTERLKVLLDRADRALQEEDLKAIVQNTREATQSLRLLAGTMEKSASGGNLRARLQDLGAAVSATRQAAETLTERLSEIPPGALRQSSQNMQELLRDGQAVVSQWSTQTNETLVLLNQNLYSLKVLLDQLVVLARTLKDAPNRILFSTTPQDPFEGQGK